MKKTLYLMCGAVTVLFHTVPRAEPPGLKWSASVGMNHYKEPEMQLHGPELGLHVRTLSLGKQAGLLGEGDLFVGQQHYSSDQTGTMDRVINVESRWRSMTRVLPGTGNTEGLYAGLGIHTLWNDLRGTTSTGGAGYERQAVQLWLPLRWVSNNAWQLETGILLRGRHTSRLSETGNGNQDVTNTQKHGAYAQVSWDYSLDPRNMITPYLRYTHLSDSDYVIMKNQYWHEPESKRWQLGLTWHWNNTP